MRDVLAIFIMDNVKFISFCENLYARNAFPIKTKTLFSQKQESAVEKNIRFTISTNFSTRTKSYLG